MTSGTDEISVEDTAEEVALNNAWRRFMEAMRPDAPHLSVASIARMVDDLHEKFAAVSPDWMMAGGGNIQSCDGGSIEIAIINQHVSLKHSLIAAEKLKELEKGPFSYSLKTLQFLRAEIREHFAAAAKFGGYDNPVDTKPNFAQHIEAAGRVDPDIPALHELLAKRRARRGTQFVP